MSKKLTVVVQTPTHQFLGEIETRCDDLGLKDILNRQERFIEVKLKSGSVTVGTNYIIWAGEATDVPAGYRVLKL